jgi:Cu-Zn family superoxide dismutase
MDGIADAAAKSWTPPAEQPNIPAMTKMLLLSSICVSVLAASALADKPAPEKKPPAAKPVTVKLSDAAGKSVGTAKLEADAGGVKITLAVKGLPPGDHAIHIHDTAKCEAPDFKSAGGHFNPEHKKHGKDNPEGAHAGDMPNFTADAKGGSTASVVAPGVTLDDGPHSVFTGGGTALMIHEKADDLKTDPTGGAGNRIACGVIKK